MTRRREVADVTLALLMRWTEEEDGCLVWTGTMTAGGAPQLYVGGAVRYVRRVVWELSRGKRPPVNRYVVAKCARPGCWHPDHLTQITRSASMQGKAKSLLHRIRLSAAACRNSALSIEDVAAIRASEEPGMVLDARYGLSQGHASQIKRGLIWKDHVQPFAGLLQRQDEGVATHGR